jgi:hypothetical protein
MDCPKCDSPGFVVEVGCVKCHYGEKEAKGLRREAQRTKPQKYFKQCDAPANPESDVPCMNMCVSEAPFDDLPQWYCHQHRA